jgi:hypothetical protein
MNKPDYLLSVDPDFQFMSAMIPILPFLMGIILETMEVEL